jgi:hypothetical protein
MNDVSWILLGLACPLGMLMMGAVGWVVAKLSGVFDRRSPSADSDG